VTGDRYVPFYWTAALFTGTPAPRHHRGFLAQCATPIDLCDVLRWWVGECATWWPEFSRRVNIEWYVCRVGETECFVQYWLGWPCQTVRPLYSWLSDSCSTVNRVWPRRPTIGSVADCGMTNIHGMPDQPIRPCVWIQVTFARRR